MRCEHTGCGLAILDWTPWCGRTLPVRRRSCVFSLLRNKVVAEDEEAPPSMFGVIWSHNTRTGPNYSDGLMCLLTRAFSTHQRPTDANLYNVGDLP